MHEHRDVQRDSELEVVEDYLVYEIDVKVKGKPGTWEVTIDAGSGKVLATEFFYYDNWASLQDPSTGEIKSHRSIMPFIGGSAGANIYDEPDLGSGEPLFAEWFLQAADLWADAGDEERAAWARREGRASAPESRLTGGGGGAERENRGTETQPPLQ